LTDFPEVLKAFLLLLSRLGPGVWEDEGEEYPQLVFNMIKDNRSYSDILVANQSSYSHWSIHWMEAYVKSLGDLPGLPSLLPLMIQYLCEELQHERFKDVRASAICIAAKVSASSSQ
jgi:senataxin